MSAKLGNKSLLDQIPYNRLSLPNFALIQMHVSSLFLNWIISLLEMCNQSAHSESLDNWPFVANNRNIVYRLMYTVKRVEDSWHLGFLESSCPSA